MDSLSALQQRPMSRMQIRSVVIAIAILILDGFDITVMAFTAAAVSTDWSISATGLGLLLSASLFGMAIGSVFIAPLADRVGRRPIVLVSLLLIMIGMFLTSMSPSVEWLFAFRVITGLGAGGMISNCVVLVSEYANNRRRSFLTAIQATGYPLGATLSGVFAGMLIPQFGWRSVFEAGAALSLVLLVIAFFWLPESLDFMLSKQRPTHLPAVNRALRSMKLEPLGAMPAWSADGEAPERQGISVLLRGDLLARSVLLWLGYGLLISGYYFINSWTPKIIAASASDPQAGVAFGVVVNAGGILGVLLFALLVLRFKPAPVLIWVLALTSAAFVGFAVFYHDFAIAITIASLLGLAATTGIGGFQTVGPQVYAPQQRASGVGFMIGFGRILSIVAPILVGALLDAGLPPEQIFLIFAAPLALSAACAFGVHRLMSRAPQPASETVPVNSAV